MEVIKSGCCKTKTPLLKSANGANGSMSFLSSVLLILLPKCPLCITAYMSAMVMFFDIEYAQLAPILLHAKPVLGAIILVLILLNNKGKRTLIAIGIASTALAFLLLSTYTYTVIVPEWVLYASFFFAIWYNGNFYYFYRFVRFKKA
tara:strand:- start:780 stop:1220 length:441 start_codon:yes stop_codon:yes gene_type:complete